MAKNELTFDKLVDSIRQVHKQLASQAGRAINIGLTLRNWVVGCYIREYEQNGADRARYGDRLLDALSERLMGSGMKGIAPRSLRLYRQFYLTYPQIWQTVSAESLSNLFPEVIWQSLSAKFETGTITGIVGTATPKLQMPPERLIKSLAFSHFVELIAIEDPLNWAFYEIECIRGNWSVRELKRQIASLYYERSGLSKNKEKLAELVRAGAEPAEPELAVRDPYIFGNSQRAYSPALVPGLASER